MNSLKRSILGLYYHATRPVRCAQRAAARRLGRAPLMVMTLHRIADDAACPWTTSHATFVNQIEWIRTRFEIVPLAEIQRRMRAPTNHTPAIALTFDDGYACNLERAIPWLLRERIPFTYFVTTEHAVRQRPFAHDVALGHYFRPHTVAQLREMAAAGVEIGAHTRTHPNLAAIRDEERLRDEIVTARDELQELIARPIRYFAFPYGRPENLSPQAFAIARQAGYAGVCSAYGGYNLAGDDPFHLQRYCADSALIGLQNWSSLDPVRWWTVRRYDRRHTFTALSPSPLAFSK